MSITDSKLARYGFVWEVSPYRVVDKKTQRVIMSGPHFDLTDLSLQTHRDALDRRSSTLFK